MKANRKFVNGDEAVSPVIAVILMVAITVVLAATVYLFVSGFGSNQNEIVSASFAAKSVDLPGGDTDSTDDAIEITYTSGTGDLSVNDVEIFLDGQSLTWLTASNVFSQGTFAAGEFCASSPGETAPSTPDTIWERGAFLYLVDTDGTTGTVGDCDGAATVANLDNLDGVHALKVVVRGQVVLDTSLEVHDDAGA